MIDAYILLSGIVFFGTYGVYRVYKSSKEKTRIIESQKREPIYHEKTQDIKIEESEPEQVYPLQTHNIKYWLYTPSYSLRTYGLAGLYNDLVVKNLWLNEPFHSKFYEILMILDKNEFMIVDSNSKVITMNVRGRDNKITTSKSFQVFATRDIVVATFSNAMSDIVRFNQLDAQHIVVAICILLLEQSLHYQSQEVSEDMIKTILKDYEFTEDIYHITTLVKGKDEQLQFVDIAVKIAFQTSSTYAYNDSEVPKPLQLPTKLPQKVLKEV
ncbi:hypothetical protein [Sulfurospirillum diekertiae]|uniref:Uncharacterized protein n=1 Tax=Sulfurospirillum diekertiae TaxID=1854492 RepID=A0A1Y0HJ86_9BACT|nr:hypothetical protein [Sulfurospirillum diekertiae]ARU48112.1 hypothetical protein Sdiek1_0946 [Sulfurospirillum diekertiae]ASC92955.1 hypothetical protein Sdiek2_0934 [Sulfurospirillum diekertiae]